MVYCRRHGNVCAVRQCRSSEQEMQIKGVPLASNNEWKAIKTRRRFKMGVVEASYRQNLCTWAKPFRVIHRISHSQVQCQNLPVSRNPAAGKLNKLLLMSTRLFSRVPWNSPYDRKCSRLSDRAPDADNHLLLIVEAKNRCRKLPVLKPFLHWS